MKSLARNLMYIAAVVTLAGCSSTPVQVQKGSIRARTFNFLHPGPLPEAAFTENRQQIHALVQEAISRRLASKGLTCVPQGGEVTVAYLIIVGNNASVSAINDYFGYTDDRQVLEDKVYRSYTGGKDRTYFEAGTLVIDIFDSRTQKLLLRNTVTRPILRNPPLDARKARLQEAVDAALTGLQVEPKA